MSDKQKRAQRVAVTDAYGSINAKYDAARATKSSLFAGKMTPQALTNLFSSSVDIQNGIMIPLNDVWKEGRSWNGTADQNILIEELVDELGYERKVRTLTRDAALYGGAALWLITNEDDQSQPLDPATIKRGGIVNLVNLTRHDFSSIDFATSLGEEGVGDPVMFHRSSVNLVNDSKGGLEIHPTRLAIVHGVDNPSAVYSNALDKYWGDSTLRAKKDGIERSAKAYANVNFLMHEAKTPIIKYNKMIEESATPEGANAIATKFVDNMLATKGNTGLTLLDSNMDYSNNEFRFTGLNDILKTFKREVASIFGIPFSKFIGDPTGGLSASDLNALTNYYDKVMDIQSGQITPALRLFDRVIVSVALNTGTFPKIKASWNPLYSEDRGEKADSLKKEIDILTGLKAASGITNETFISNIEEILTKEGYVITKPVNPNDLNNEPVVEPVPEPVVEPTPQDNTDAPAPE